MSLRQTGPQIRPALAETSPPTHDDQTHVNLSVDTSDAGLRIHVMNGSLSSPIRTDPVGTTTQPVSFVPAVSGGCSISRTMSANNTTGIVAKGSAGQLYGWSITNANAAVRFVKIYDKATAPTVGTDVPKLTIAIPASNAPNAAQFDAGIAFTAGIGIGITTLVADNDTTAPAANEIIVHLFFK